MLVAGEAHEREDRHHLLTDLQLLEPRSQVAGAAPAAVVDQVVRIGRGPQLTQPAEDGRGVGRVRVGRGLGVPRPAVRQAVGLGPDQAPIGLALGGTSPEFDGEASRQLVEAMAKTDDYFALSDLAAKNSADILEYQTMNDSTAVIKSARNVTGSIRLPGDKSISHRYAMLGAIAEGDTKIENYSTGADCVSTLGSVRGLGVQWERDGGSVVIHGKGPQLQAQKAALDCGNSGSTIRMISGILAGQNFTTELFGDESLSKRPMARVITPLETMGAKIISKDGGRPPLRITGGKLHAIEYNMPVPSAQVKSCLLHAGLFADGETKISESSANGHCVGPAG